MDGTRIKQLRMEKGLSLTQLAQLAHVSKSYLSTIERNVQKNPSIAFLKKISRVLNVEMDELINHQDHIPSSDSLEEEWIKLSREAASSGIDIEEFKALLQYERWKKQKKTIMPK